MGYDFDLLRAILFLALMLFIALIFFAVSNLYYKSAGNKSLKKSYGVVKYLFVIILSLFAALRKVTPGFGGTDAYNYYTFFKNATGGFFNYLKVMGIEPGFCATLYFFRSITDNYIIFQFIYYFVFCSILFKINELIQVKQFYLYFFYSFTYLISFCLMRNYMSYILGWLAIIYLTQGKTLRSCFLSLIAFSMHYTAIILFPVICAYKFFIYKKYNHKNIFYIIVMLLPAVYVLFKGISVVFSGKIALYLSNGGFALGQNLFKIVFMYIFYNYFKPKDEKQNAALIIFALSLVIIPIQLVGQMFYRMIIFFDVCILMMFSSLKREDEIIRTNFGELLKTNSNQVIMCNLGGLIYIGYYIFYYLTIGFFNYGIYQLAF